MYKVVEARASQQIDRIDRKRWLKESQKWMGLQKNQKYVFEQLPNVLV